MNICHFLLVNPVQLELDFSLWIIFFFFSIIYIPIYSSSIIKITHFNFNFQMDMHELIEDQMKKQLNDSTFKTRQPITTTTAAPKKTYRLLSLFQR